MREDGSGLEWLGLKECKRETEGGREGMSQNTSSMRNERIGINHERVHPPTCS